MSNKYNLLICVGVLLFTMVATVYTEKSPTAKRVMGVAQKKLSDERVKKDETLLRSWLREMETILFLGKPATISMNGTVLVSDGAIETASIQMMKQLATDDSFEIYGSSTSKGSFLAVYDVMETLSATANQHLRNHIKNNIMGPDYENIVIDLNEYSLFLFYYKHENGSGQVIMEARWIPTEFRESELQYERYEKQLDLDIWPNNAVNNDYLNDISRSDMEQLFREQRRERRYKAREQYLLRDSTGKAEVIPVIESKVGPKSAPFLLNALEERLTLHELLTEKSTPEDLAGQVVNLYMFGMSAHRDHR